MVEKHRKSWRVRTKFKNWPNLIITTGASDEDEKLARRYDKVLADLHAAGRRDVFEAIAKARVAMWDVEKGVQVFTAAHYHPPAATAPAHAPQEISLGELTNEWFEWMQQPTTVSKRGGRAYSQSTIRRWRQSWSAVFSALPSGRSTPANALTGKVLAQVLDQRMKAGLSPSGANRDASAVGALYTWAIEFKGLAVVRPHWRKLPEPDANREEDAHIEREDLETAIATVAGRWGNLWDDFWRLLAETGLRIGELQHLQARDIREEYIAVVERSTYRLKTSTSARRVPKTPVAAGILRRLLHGLRPGDYILPEELRSYQAARYRWEAMMLAAGFLDEDARVQGIRRHAYTIHALRHLFGVTAARAGFSLLEIMGLMGHANESTTRRYARFRPDDEDMDRYARGLAAAFKARLSGPTEAPALIIADTPCDAHVVLPGFPPIARKPAISS